MQRITRRDFFRASAGVALAIGAMQRPVTGATAVGLAVERSVFDNALGAGTDIADGLVQYGSADNAPPMVLVRFGEHGAEYIEEDYSALTNGGRDDEAFAIGTSPYLPVDKQGRTSISLGSMRLNRSHFNLVAYTSASLAKATGGSGNVLVSDESFQYSPAGGGIAIAWPRNDSATEFPDVVKIAPSGREAMIGGPMAGWESTYGDHESGQTAEVFQGTPFGDVFVGMSGDVVSQVDIEPPTPISMKDAVSFVGSCLPPDARLGQSHWNSPTPSGPIGLRTQLWWSAKTRAGGLGGAAGRVGR